MSAGSWASVLLFSLLLTQYGCERSPTPTKDLLARDLQAYYDVNPICLPIAISFPAEIQSIATDPYGELLTALQSHGLASLAPTRRLDLRIPSKRFELTGEGLKFVRPNSNKRIGGSEICYASRRILAVKSFSSGGIEAAAQAASLRVTYTYDLKNSGDWVSAADIMSAIMFTAGAYSSAPKSETETLIPKGTHWVPLR